MFIFTTFILFHLLENIQGKHKNMISWIAADFKDCFGKNRHDYHTIILNGLAGLYIIYIFLVF